MDLGAFLNCTQQQKALNCDTNHFRLLQLRDRTISFQIHLWDPLDSFFPSSLGLRDESGTPIQLAHLATHSSGLPNDPDNLVTKK